MQWAAGKVLANLPAQYFNLNANVTSLWDLFPNSFNSTPEFSVFCSQYLNTNVTYPIDSAALAFAYQRGSILSTFEIYYLYYLSSSNNETGLQSVFGISQDVAQSVLLYFSELYYKIFLPGKFTTINAYDLLWGYTDSFIQQLSSQGSMLDGFRPFDPVIQFSKFSCWKWKGMHYMTYFYNRFITIILD